LISEDVLKPDIISYNITLNGLCSCDRVTDAVGFLNDSLADGVLPTVIITCNILVRAVIFYTESTGFKITYFGSQFSLMLVQFINYRHILLIYKLILFIFVGFPLEI